MFVSLWKMEENILTCIYGICLRKINLEVEAGEGERILGWPQQSENSVGKVHCLRILGEEVGGPDMVGYLGRQLGWYLLLKQLLQIICRLCQMILFSLHFQDGNTIYKVGWLFRVQSFGSEQKFASLGIGKCACRDVGGFIVKWVEECGRSWDLEGFARSFSFSGALDFFAMNSSLASSALVARMCS